MRKVAGKIYIGGWNPEIWRRQILADVADSDWKTRRRWTWGIQLINNILFVDILHIGVTPYTANEGSVRIQCKCLVPIYVFIEMKLVFPKQNYNLLSPSFLHSCICERFIYFQDQSAYSAVGKYVDFFWEFIKTHECGNWDWGRAILRKGIHK